MHEARARNPAVVLDSLPWSYPAWCGGAFTQKSAEWYVAFIDCAKQSYGLNLDYTGAGWNERGTNPDWVVNHLRPTLNQGGYKEVKLQGPDDSSHYWQIFDQFDADPKFRDAIDAVSYHIYGMTDSTDKARASGKPLWMSETTSRGGLQDLKQLIKFYVKDRLTKYEIWCPVASCYEDHTGYAQVGCVQANQPWSGHYVVRDGAWYIAHVTQFAKPGWRFLDPGCVLFDSSGLGGCVVLRDPTSNQWSLIAGTKTAETVTVTIGSGLATGPLHVWKSTGSMTFLQQPDINPSGGAFTIKMDANSAYSITTTSGQQKGQIPHPVPAASRFPFPYTENFDDYQAGEAPRYFMDQKGTFEVADGGKSGKCLKEIVPAQGTVWWECLKPNTIFGDNMWESYELSSDVKIMGGDAEIGAWHDDRSKLGYRLTLDTTGKWTLSYHTQVLATGAITGFDGGAWHNLKLDMLRTDITAFVDNTQVCHVQAVSKSVGGRCFLASTYNPNLFDNLHVSPLDAALPRDHMTATATSCYGEIYQPQNALDGDLDTIWHSAMGKSPVLSQSITINLGGTFTIGRLTYLPRRDGGAGKVTAYNIYTSLDGTHFTKVDSGTWENNSRRKASDFPPTSAAYVRLEATAGTENAAAASEINVYPGKPE